VSAFFVARMSREDREKRITTDGTIYIVSDAHIGAPFPDAAVWEREFIEFVEKLPDGTEALYILGDLFDFWIEYGRAIRSDYFNVLCALKNLTGRGIAIHYFAGNHDFAFGPFITETLGMVVHAGEASFELQGKRVHLFHGDGLIRRDFLYRLMKKLLRNPFNQALYKLLPTELGISLASFCSASSRRAGERFMNEKIVDEYREHALAILEKGSDIVFFGHSHHAELSGWGSRIYCNTGAWMRHYNYATLSEGKVRLWCYRGHDAPQEIQIVDRNAGKSVS
jgi:UDP-2,3-diacylglucosamine hydrolase